MIDNNSSITQAAQVKLLNETVTEVEIKARAAAIEKVSKVGTEQHKSTMEYLEQRAGQELAAQLAANELASSEENKKNIDKNRSSSTDSANVALNEEAINEEAKKLAASEGISLEEAKKIILANKNTNQDASQVAINEEVLNEEAQKLAASEGISLEEAKKMILARNIEDGTVNQDGETTLPGDSVVIVPGDGQEVDPDILLNPNVGVEDPNALDEGMTLPLGPNDPLEPPKPPEAFPPGFDLDSLFNSKLEGPAAILTRLSMMMADALTESTERRIGSQKELTLKTNELQQQSIEEQTAKQIEELKKAEEAAKTGTCISTIIAVILLVAAAALVVFTGGAASAVFGLAVAAVLFIADMALQAQGKQTLSSMIFEPVVTNVIMPIIEFLGGIISDILVSLGVDEQTANLVGMILAAIILVIAIIAIVFVAKNFGPLQAVISAVAARMGAMLSTVTPTVVKEAAKGVSKAVGQAATKAMAKMGVSQGASATAAAATQTGMIVAGGVGALAAGSADIASAEFQRKATVTQAELEQLFYQLLVSSEDLKDLQEKLAAAYQTMQDLMDAAFETQKGSYETARAVLNNIAKGV